jgi:uncharacterized protein (TIGR02118 family)
MIHQHIFASPKPGMTEKQFQDYWLNVHAVKFASKITQIKKYKIDTRIDWKGEVKKPIWSGIAEIWLKNPKEQLESLQSKPFLQGARLDEPKWAAFWNTLVLDTDAHVIKAGPPEKRECPGVKLVVLVKRKPGMSVADYRKYHLDRHVPLVEKIPAIRRHLVCFTRDSWYAVGEPRFDGIVQAWFDDVASLDRMLETREFIEGGADDVNFLEPKHIFFMAVKEHWVIGPKARK